MLRFYQEDLKQRTYAEWRAGARNVMAVLPTGGGKTRLFGSVISEMACFTVVAAHRNELVGQISLTLGAYGIPHRVIASTVAIRQIVSLHHREFGRSWVNQTSDVVCASVDTLLNRKEPWFPRVKLWVMDEGHHLLAGNKWGEATRLFPNAIGLSVTATPERADGKGLGRHADGVIDSLVVGPTGRDLMSMGYLSDYDTYCPPTVDLDFSEVELGSTGDLKNAQLRKATHASKKLTGDVVQHYLRLASGKLGITFAVDVEQAEQLAEQYRAAGVPAQMVSGKTDPITRANALQAFRDRRLLQLVNVDLFGEGFDVPGVEVVSMARRTESFSLFAQQVGRCWRPVYAPGMPLETDAQRLEAIRCGGKPRALLIDHVGNYILHGMRKGPPEEPKNWTLDARDRKSRTQQEEGVIALSTCPGCSRPYERFRTKCPHCGHIPEPAKRSTVEAVGGDLELLDDKIRALLMQAVAKADGPPQIPRNATPIVVASIQKNYRTRQEAQRMLRAAIAQWGGWRKQEGLTDREAQRLFWDKFGTDVLTAQTLGAREATELQERIERNMI